MDNPPRSPSKNQTRWTNRAAQKWNAHAQKISLNATVPAFALFILLFGAYLFFASDGGMTRSNPAAGLAAGIVSTAPAALDATGPGVAALALADDPASRRVIAVPMDYLPVLSPLQPGRVLPSLPERYRIGRAEEDKPIPGVVDESTSPGELQPGGADSPPSIEPPLIRFAAGELLVSVKPHALSGILDREIPLRDVAGYAPNSTARPFFEALAENEFMHSQPARIRRVKMPLGLAGESPENGNTLYTIALRADADILSIVRSFDAQRRINPNAFADVLAVQPNYAYEPTVLPNDPRLGIEWGLNNTGQTGGVPDTDIDAPEAWNVFTGSPTLVIADIDTGVNYNHPDLAANMWHNPGEIPANGIDDEGDGYVDDVYGWDFYSDDADPMDYQGHGTHTSGTIAAVTNNGIGISGVCWNCKIMALKFFGPNGGFTDDAIRAFAYATLKGASITSNSWAGGMDDPLLHAAIQTADAAGVLTIAAAGNLNGEFPMYPGYYPEVVSVAAIDWANEPSWFSNHNLQVDVAGPGSQVQSTIYPSSELVQYCPTDLDATHYYASCSGTSMAAPHIAGIAGLLKSRNPALTPNQMKSILRTATDPINVSGVNPDYYFGTGRINASRALDLALNPPLGVLDASNLNGLLSGTIPIHGSVGPGTYILEYGAGLYPATWIPFASGNGPLSNGTLGLFSTVGLDDGKYLLRLRATNGGNTIHDQTFVSVDNLLITYPGSEYNNPDFIKTGTILPIIGTVASAGFQNYTIEWCAYPDVSHACSLGPFTTGISLTDGGMHAVYDSRIGQFDTSQITAHLDASRPWKIMLTVHVNGTQARTESAILHVDPQLRWMKRISDDPESQQYILSPNEPTVADLDGDGKKEICALMKNALTCLSAQGAVKPGFPLFFPTVGSQFYIFYQVLPLTVIDVGDGDPEPELLFTAYIGDSGTDPRIGVYAVNGNGTLATGYPRKFHEVSSGTNGNGFPTESTPIVAAQLIPGGPPEFIARNFDVLIPFDAQGTILSGTPINLRAYDSDEFIQGDQPIGWSNTIATGNFDEDPGMEIVAVHQYGYGNLPGGYGRVWVLNPDGSVLSGWPRAIETATRSSPVIADLDYDGKDEIILGLFPGYISSAASTGLYAFNSRGELLPGFPWQEKMGGLSIPTQVLETPAVADLDQDGDLELVFATTNTFNGGTWHLQAVTHDGETFPGWVPQPNIGQLNPRIVDTSAYPGNEIYDAGISPQYGEGISGFTTQSGTLAPDFPKYSHYSSVAAPILDDLDGDGKIELIAGTNHPFMGLQTTAHPNAGTIFVYDMTTPAGPTTLNSAEWPMFQHDLQRTGKYTRPTLPPAPTPALNLGASVDKDASRITITFLNAALAPIINVYRSPTNAPCPAGALVQTLNFVPASEPISVIQTTQDNGIQTGANYYYSIGTANASGETCTPTAVLGRANAPPGPPIENPTRPGPQTPANGGISIGGGTTPPSDLTANDGTHGDRIRTTWTGIPGAQYHVYRAASNNPGQAILITPAPVPITLYTDYSITPGQPYWYWATALLPGAGESTFSNGDPGYALGKPTSVSASDGTFPDRIDITWSSVNGATDYAIYRDTSNTACAGNPLGGAVGTTYPDTGLNGGSTYYYSIQAHAPPGYGLCSPVDAGTTSSSERKR